MWQVSFDHHNTPVIDTSKNGNGIRSMLLISVSAFLVLAMLFGLVECFLITSTDDYSALVVFQTCDNGSQKLGSMFEEGGNNGESTQLEFENHALAIPTSASAHFIQLSPSAQKTVADMPIIQAKKTGGEDDCSNQAAQAPVVPSDPYFAAQWHLDNAKYGGINMQAAWGIETGRPDIVVAIMDTGIAYEDYDVYHLAPDLAQATFVPGCDFVNNDEHPNDDNGHGTHIAGVVAQSTNNGLGGAGIAYNCSIMPIKVLDANAQGTYSDVAAGIRWAVEHGANIINISFIGDEQSDILREAVAYAYAEGVTVVAAAGNGGASKVGYPAAYNDYVIAVGATLYDENLAPYSNYGADLDLTAPGGKLGVDQNSDTHDDGILQQSFIYGNYGAFEYQFLEGTSQAAAHVAGVVALLLSHGVVGPDNIRDVLQCTAEDHGEPGWDQKYGWGIVDAKAALLGPPQPNDQPVGDTGGPYTVNEDSELTIDASGSRDSNSDHMQYKWDFGDGSIAVTGVPTVVHKYTNGQPNVAQKQTLTLVVNDGRLDSLPVTTTVTVTGINDHSEVDIVWAYATSVGNSLKFDASRSYDEEGIAAYTWAFGDGTIETVTAPTIVHTYSEPNTYLISLTVTDTYGATAVSYCEVSVTAELTGETTHTGGLGQWGMVLIITCVCVVGIMGLYAWRSRNNEFAN